MGRDRVPGGAKKKSEASGKSSISLSSLISSRPVSSRLVSRPASFESRFVVSIEGARSSSKRAQNIADSHVY